MTTPMTPTGDRDADLLDVVLRLRATNAELLAALKAIDSFVREEEAAGDDAVWTDAYRYLVDDIRAAIENAEKRP